MLLRMHPILMHGLLLRVLVWSTCYCGRRSHYGIRGCRKHWGSSEDDRVWLERTRVEAESDASIVHLGHYLSSLDTYRGLRIWIKWFINYWGARALTRKVIVRLATLLRYIKLVEVNVLIVEQEVPLYLSEMFVEPIDGAYHQISAIQMLLYLNLSEGFMRKPESERAIVCFLGGRRSSSFLFNLLTSM